MWLCKYFVYFVIYSVMGWIYETIYVTARSGKWDNRGFLYGPVVPIYGVGGVMLTMLMDLIHTKTSFGYTWWQVFLVSFLGSIVLEYSTSWVLEKFFHARWWDYSRMPLNINGRVCFPYSCGFGFAGLLVVYVIAPATQDATDWVTPILYELFGLLMMAAITADATLTVSALTDFSEQIASMDDAMNQHMDAFVAEWEEKRKAAGEAFAESVEVLKSGDREAVAAMFAEERERFAQAHLETTLGGMSHAKRSALSRVQNFNHPRIEKQQVQAITSGIRTRLKAEKARLKAEKARLKAENGKKV